MEFASRDGKKGGPPGLRSVRGSLDWAVRGEEGGESREMAVEPCLEGEQARKLWAAGKATSPRRGVRESQSVRAQFGEGSGGEMTRGERVMVMGT